MSAALVTPREPVIVERLTPGRLSKMVDWATGYLAEHPDWEMAGIGNNNQAWARDVLTLAAALIETRAALLEYIEHDLGGVHLRDGAIVADYEPCEHLHRRLGQLAYPDKAAAYAVAREEYGDTGTERHPFTCAYCTAFPRPEWGSQRDYVAHMAAIHPGQPYEPA